MSNVRKLFSYVLPNTHAKEIDEIHQRVSEELVVTEKKIKKLNAYLRSEEVARLLVETLAEEARRKKRKA